MLYIAGEDIDAGDIVGLNLIDGKVYRIITPPSGTHMIGCTVERIRDGFRVVEKDGEVREDDA